MSARSWNSGADPNGFNGKRKDDETYGGGDSYDFGSRIYDPRLGRWLSVDPLQARYASISPYAFCAGNPITCIDPDGQGVNPVTNIDYCGPANVQNTGDIGNTQGHYELSFNKSTNEYDIQVSNHIQYSSAFMDPGANGKTLEQENPGLGLAVRTHEEEHANANVAAAEHVFTYTSDLLGNDKPVTGRADQIATTLNRAHEEHKNILFKEIDEKIEKKYAPLISAAGSLDEIQALKQKQALERRQEKQAVINEEHEKFKGELNELLSIVKSKAAELNLHKVPGGINDRTAAKLSGNPQSERYQDGSKPIKSQGKEVPNSKSE
jgi:RHS repeat-associated protein